MKSCSLWSPATAPSGRRMGQFKFYLLVPRHTPAYSLIANAMLMCRFAPPLAFNFMAALAMPPSDHHTFKVCAVTLCPVSCPG